MANIHGLGPVGKKADGKAGKNEEFSTGGHTSGQAVLRPVKSGDGKASSSSNSGNDIQDILNNARGQAGNPAVHDKNLCLITIYSNGFQVGSGPFRDTKDAKNQQFLTDLKKGVVPKELEPDVRRDFPGATQVGVQLVNKSTQPFSGDTKGGSSGKKEDPKFDFSASAGFSLKSDGASGSNAFAAAKPKLHVVDESQPTTDIQLVTSDRKKTKVTFNQSATVLEVYQHMQAISGIAKFDLLGGGGIPKPLTNPNATLKDANLLNSSFQQKVAPAPAAAGRGAGRGAGSSAAAAAASAGGRGRGR